MAQPFAVIPISPVCALKRQNTIFLADLACNNKLQIFLRRLHTHTQTRGGDYKVMY